MELLTQRQKQVENIYKSVSTEVANLKADMLGIPRVVESEILYDPMKSLERERAATAA